MEIGMVRFLGRDIHFPHGYGPRRDAACWFTSGVICSGGEETIKYLSPGPLKGYSHHLSAAVFLLQEWISF